ncbi:LacI family DNA-binding transcriptional regulator [Peribacillus sp. NPDC096379]|uniref:LacI family DNA-binding transcriptional regulator n=1 Tax=Peribacillus sp. NPDC096379 TaxID=3364393 RepID=UPI003828E66A
MATIKDIAKEANVSVTTVSNVIHNRASRVSTETVNRVQSILEKYNYIPNMNARSLVNNKSKLIGVFFNQLTEETLFESPFNTEILGGVDEVLKDNGYYLLVRSISSISEIQQVLKTWKVDGVICLGFLVKDVIDLERSINTPLVLIDIEVDHKNSRSMHLTVGINDWEGSKIATEHLIENGHHNIGFVSYPIVSGGVIERRYLGYLEALNNHGVKQNTEFIFEYDKTKVSLDEICDEIVKKIDDITGLVFTADYLAIEIMDNLKKQGILVPNDLSVVGFDDIVMSQFVSPKLTSIHQDIRLKGRKAATLLIELLNGDTNQESKKVELPIQLITRESVKKFRK